MVAAAQREPITGAIEFSKVSFTYADKSQPVLHNLSFKIEPGQTVALVGASGAGKTTITSLLLGFYQGYLGQILIDGRELAQENIQNLRANIAYVSQHVTLFDTTLEANIIYGQEIKDACKLQLALEQSGLAKIIAQLPEGLATVVGQNGLQLSGGQRQRLAIARAIYKDCPVLILDEATSALDSQSEEEITAAMVQLLKGRTALVIAHRLSTIEQADNILVLEAGTIVEQGCHSTLLAQQGAYYNFYRHQYEHKQLANQAVG